MSRKGHIAQDSYYYISLWREFNVYLDRLPFAKELEAGLDRRRGGLYKIFLGS
jgi:hypothetical protein